MGKGKGKAKAKQLATGDDDHLNENDPAAASNHSLSTSPTTSSPPLTNPESSPTPYPSTRPGYMTVGSGSGSEHTARLQQMLDADSGYGGSTMDGADTAAAAAAALAWADPSAAAAAHPDRPDQSGALHQLWYNQHRITLGRTIGRAIELLRGLQEMNSTWPAHYPSVQRAEVNAPTRRPAVSHTMTGASRPGSSSDSAGPASPYPMLKRAMTAVEEEGESSRAAERRVGAVEPRLVTPQIAQEFSVLKLDLKIGSLHQAELVHSLEKHSIASLLDGRIGSSIRHMLALRERIEDTSSKVLITGDLNAGKSTFCNALLRRKVLPEDQQPCTAIFCEVLDARENMNREEVHAVHANSVYDRSDESTYNVFGLEDLEGIVTDNETYHQCKVYVTDVRRVDQSLLCNGVVDIALIDAPGLNSDTTKTTAIFARQEEIDVVVFVVSAANHFTLTANEFIMSAAAEKSYFFIVVNGYDNIRDKERCRKTILKQVGVLSPHTAKEEAELVHFVSSNAIPMTSPHAGSGPGGSSSSGGGGHGGDDDGPDDNGPEGKGKGKDVEKIRDFERLEQSLRRFVLEKRAQSKLAPAKTYLLNILNDINVLAAVNTDVARSELDRVVRELRELEPQLESSKRARTDVCEQVDTTIDQTCKEIYDHTHAALAESIEHLGDESLGVPYPGLLAAFQYADALKEAMLSHVMDAVVRAEDHARKQTVRGVNIIKQLGILHLGDEYENLTFRSDVMFRKRRDALARQVEVSAELADFVDWSLILQNQEKMAGTGMALTIATAVVPRMMGVHGWLDHALSAAKILGNDNVRRLIIPGLVVATFGAAYYVLCQIPHSLPHRLSAKVSAQLAGLNYVHSNANRISSSSQKVLRIPADHLRLGLEQSVRQLGQKRDETVHVREESEGALKYFSNLVRESGAQRAAVAGVDLNATHMQ